MWLTFIIYKMQHDRQQRYNLNINYPSVNLHQTNESIQETVLHGINSEPIKTQNLRTKHDFDLTLISELQMQKEKVRPQKMGWK